MKSLLKRLCWIVAIGIISYSYHLDRCYSAVVEAQTQQQGYHMDLPPTEFFGLGEQIKLDQEINCLIIGNYRLIFPLDAHQPTTEEAVRWSCANADSDMSEENRLQSPITDWYMKMFGVIPFRNEDDPSENDYIKAGYDEENQIKRIISYDANMTPEQRQTFIDNFRKIASTSVGRVLLYRLLIEIRRSSPNNNGVEEGKTTDDMKIRNATRCINVLHSDHNSFKTSKIIPAQQVYGYYSNNNNQLSKAIFNFYELPLQATVVGKQENDLCHIVLEPRSLDIAVFHEMCHWYHFIRDHVRFSKEESGENDLELIPEEYLTPPPKEPNQAQLAWCWVLGSSSEDRTQFNYYYMYEEMRNILGVKNEEQSRLEGDDLCENLYRACCKTYLRFGHSDAGYEEKAENVAYAIEIVNENKSAYGITYEIKRSERKVSTNVRNKVKKTERRLSAEFEIKGK